MLESGVGVADQTGGKVSKQWLESVFSEIRDAAPGGEDWTRLDGVVLTIVDAPEVSYCGDGEVVGCATADHIDVAFRPCAGALVQNTAGAIAHEIGHFFYGAGHDEKTWFGEYKNGAQVGGGLERRFMAWQCDGNDL